MNHPTNALKNAPKNEPSAAASPDLTPLPPLPLRSMVVLMRCLSWALAGGLLVLALAWGALHFWIVPRIDEHRPRLQAMATQALGVPVRIGAIEALPAGWVPWLELRDVALLDPAGREALRLPKLRVALSVFSVLSGGFDQLYIESPELDIRRRADGRVLVGGLDFLAADDGTAANGADWFFSQREFVIRGGTVRWSDELSGAPPLALQAVDVVIRNRARRHDLRLDATPPPGWGERFVLMGQFRRPLLARYASQTEHWSGQLYADFARIDLSRLRQYAKLDVDVAQGSGALRLWADVTRGQLSGATLDVALTEVTATLGAGLEALALRRVSGRLGAKRVGPAEGFEVYTEGLQFQTQDGLQWPAGNVFVAHQPAHEGAPASGELRADRLELAALSQIANRLPLPAASYDQLKAHPVRGLVENLSARWQGPLAAPTSYQARGRVAGLEIGATPARAAASPPSGAAVALGVPGLPGIRGASLDFDLSQSGGRASVQISKGALTLPGVFEGPVLPIDHLNAEAQWAWQGARLVVSKAALKLANADLAGEFKGSWQTSEPGRPVAGAPVRPRFPGVLDLQGSLSRLDAARLHSYLPLALPEDARHYVRDAVLRGAASAVTVRVKGNLAELPFARPAQGEFKITAKLRELDLAYVPARLQDPGDKPWPALRQLAGELVVDRSSLDMKFSSGRIDHLPGPVRPAGTPEGADPAGALGLQLGAVQARIPDLGHNATVSVSAEARGPATQVLHLINDSPVGGWIDGLLGPAKISGDATTKLRLTLPLDDLTQAKVQGSVSLLGSDVRMTPDTPLMANAKALIQFSDTGFAIVGGEAQMLGGDLRLEGGSRTLPAGSKEASVVLRAQGTVSAQGLRRAEQMRFLPGLLQGASGSTSYSATLGFKQGHTELLINSDLRGLALALPPPLAKPAQEALPVRFEQVVLTDDPPPGLATALRDRMSLELGRLAQITYLRDISGEQPRVLRGSIGIGLEPGEGVALPERGVAANIHLTQVNLDAWNEVLGRGPSSTSEAARGYLPNVLAVRADELSWGGRKLHQVVLGGGREGTVWRANLDARQLNGYLEYRQASDAGAGRVYARLARLTLEPSTAQEVESLLDAQPATIPALDIVVDDLDLRGKKLGHLEVEAINRVTGGVREWRLDKLNLITPQARLLATGRWAATGAGGAPGTTGTAANEKRRMQLDFKLELADAGALLERLGMKGVIREGKGLLDGQVAWAGSPLSLDYPSLNGQFHVNVENGQFLKADPGMAKLLGVLSLQSLPRRLSLDFRDVFSDGFGFDFVRGDVLIAAGLASTNNLQMKGVNAAVLMDGRADIAKETQDIRVVVVPEIDAGTASLLATVINPAVGLGTFLAQWFLRRPLIQANTQEFHVSGSWAEPRVTKVPNPTLPAPAKAAGTP